ncbi:hypothetical protein BJ138DRAFT_1020789, partial [Hygrophoropsis aurantiaca]
IVAQLQHSIPEVFTAKASDGSTFRCSESWVRKFLFDNLRWTMRRGTRAAQKLPKNCDELCHEQFLRLALTMHDGVIPHTTFLINID